MKKQVMTIIYKEEGEDEEVVGIRCVGEGELDEALENVTCLLNLLTDPPAIVSDVARDLHREEKEILSSLREMLEKIDSFCADRDRSAGVLDKLIELTFLSGMKKGFQLKEDYPDISIDDDSVRRVIMCQ
ncbi:MAG: hypothetical protein PHX25_01520 [Candidatus Pacebacteria bacterium]|nr:hypothetical protein [Candidatus Paceibacterota bacterium]